MEDNSFYAQYGKRASGVITSGKVPGHEGHTFYVWFDALLGYLSALIPNDTITK